jgi:glycosyltransferase involved in cell wall biosynthesis
VWIYDCAEYYAENLAAYWGPFERAARPLVRAWERRLLAPLVGILTVDSRGDWYERRLAATGLPVLVVPNYPSRGDDPPEIPPPVMHGDGVLAYVGGIQEDKGLDVMLEAVRLLRRTRAVRLLLVGPVAGLREDLRARIRALGLPDEAVETLPPVAYRDLVALLSARSDVGFALYQSGMIARGLGWRNARKVFTYMQAGLAVLVPKEGEIARPVLDAGAGLAVRAEDPAAVAAAVSALLADPEELARTRRRSRSAFLARHNWEGFVPVLDAWLADRLSAATSVTDRARSRGRKEVGRG